MLYEVITPEEPLLPWKSELGDRKVSPFTASERYLEHLRHAFEQLRTTDGRNNFV